MFRRQLPHSIRTATKTSLIKRFEKPIWPIANEVVFDNVQIMSNATLLRINDTVSSQMNDFVCNTAPVHHEFTRPSFTSDRCRQELIVCDKLVS